MAKKKLLNANETKHSSHHKILQSNLKINKQKSQSIINKRQKKNEQVVSDSLYSLPSQNSAFKSYNKINRNESHIANNVQSSKSLPTQLTISDKVGNVLTMGTGDVGQLGLGMDILEKSRPTLVPTFAKNVIDICAGGMHTACITKDGEVYTWGCNDESALGRKTKNENENFIPDKVELPGIAVQITAGDSHTAVLLSNGTVFIWGTFRDSSGILGLVDNSIKSLPVQLCIPEPVVKISSGVDHIACLSNQGILYTCGSAEQGQLGRVSRFFSQRGGRRGLDLVLSPSSVKVYRRPKIYFSDCWTGSYATYAKEKVTNTIYVFGLNNYNQLGLPHTDIIYQPMPSLDFNNRNWKKISGGQHHAVALDSKGFVYALGRKEYGRLGLGDINEDAQIPTLIPTLSTIKCIDICSGEAVSFCISDSGSLYAWGMGTNNQLGLGENDIYIPTKVESTNLKNKKVLRVESGGQHSVILAS